MPSVAAGVIMETPPGGRRGSMAVVLVEFLLLELPVMVPPVVLADPELEPDIETDALPLLLLLSLLSLLPEVWVAAADVDCEADCDWDADVDCAARTRQTISKHN